MTTDQNPIKKPEALRLAAAISGWYAPARASSADCDKAADLLLTQHALLEQSRHAIKSLLDDIDDPCDCPADDKWCPQNEAREVLAALSAHLEPKP